MVRRATMVAVGLVLAVTGCGHDDSSTPAAPSAQANAPATAPASPSHFDCAASILGHRPTKDYTVVLGAVALPTSPRSAAIQVSTSPERGPRLFAKSGLLVRVGRPSVLRASVRDGGAARIGWRNGGVVPTRRLVIPACPGNGEGRWRTYPGGFFVDHRACLTIRVTAHGRTRVVRVGVGTPCPGQRPVPKL